MAIIVFKVDFRNTTNIRTLWDIIYKIICTVGPEHLKNYSLNFHK